MCRFALHWNCYFCNRELIHIFVFCFIEVQFELDFNGAVCRICRDLVVEREKMQKARFCLICLFLDATWRTIFDPLQIYKAHSKATKTRRFLFSDDYTPVETWLLPTRLKNMDIKLFFVNIAFHLSLNPTHWTFKAMPTKPSN